MEIRELDLIEIGENGEWEEKIVSRDSRKNGKRNNTERNNAERNNSHEQRIIIQQNEPFTEENILRKKRRKRRRRNVRLLRTAMLTVSFAAVIVLFLIVMRMAESVLTGMKEKGAVQTISEVKKEDFTGKNNSKWKAFYEAQLERPLLDVQLLTVNNYSRPGISLPEVKNIFIHYTANVGTSALQNRSYFESLSETHERSASAHFVIGYDGEIVQCIPTKEIAYAVMKRNYDSISIECCYLEEDGRFTQETYDSLLELTAWLLYTFELTPEDVLRHYDEGGKNCPKYYVENEQEWNKFLQDLNNYMENAAG